MGIRTTALLSPCKSADFQSLLTSRHDMATSPVETLTESTQELNDSCMFAVRIS